jgi:hypothetical protein
VDIVGAGVSLSGTAATSVCFELIALYNVMHSILCITLISLMGCELHTYIKYDVRLDLETDQKNDHDVHGQSDVICNRSHFRYFFITIIVSVCAVDGSARQSHKPIYKNSCNNGDLWQLRS